MAIMKHIDSIWQRGRKGSFFFNLILFHKDKANKGNKRKHAKFKIWKNGDRKPYKSE